MPDAEGADFRRLYRPQGGVLGGPALYDAADSDTAFLTDKTIGQLDVRKARPWSALVSYIRPHPPYVAPAPYHALVDPASVPPAVAQPDHPFFDAFHAMPTSPHMFWGFDGRQRALSPDTVATIRAAYLGLVAELDGHIRRLLRWLTDSGQAQDTLVVLTADHGDMLGDMGTWGKHPPFRQSTHIPLMLCGAGIEPDVVTRPTRSIDVLPTILTRLDASLPPALDGQDLLAGKAASGVMAEVELGSPAVRAVTWETETWRLVTFTNAMPQMLFNVADDPCCQHDVAARHPADVAVLTRQVLQHRLRHN